MDDELNIDQTHTAQDEQTHGSGSGEKLQLDKVAQPPVSNWHGRVSAYGIAVTPYRKPVALKASHPEEVHMSTLDEPLLTPDEGLLVTRLRDIGGVAVLAIRCYILTGDLRLVRAIYDQVCLGIRPR